MDYLTAIGRLFVYLLASGLSFRLFDYLKTINFDSVFGSLTLLWLSFGFLTVLLAINFDYLPTI